jgi:hypothetical protein
MKFVLMKEKEEMLHGKKILPLMWTGRNDYVFLPV